MASGTSVRLTEALARRIDALLERGLERYGRGELLAALSEWEHALMLVPDEPRATEYIEYVRDNFDLLEETFRQARQDAADAIRSQDEVVPPREPLITPPRIALDELAAGWTADEPLPPSFGTGLRLPGPPSKPSIHQVDAGLPEDPATDEPEISFEAEPPDSIEDVRKTSERLAAANPAGPSSPEQSLGVAESPLPPLDAFDATPTATFEEPTTVRRTPAVLPPGKIEGHVEPPDIDIGGQIDLVRDESDEATAEHLFSASRKRAGDPKAELHERMQTLLDDAREAYLAGDIAAAYTAAEAAQGQDPTSEVAKDLLASYRQMIADVYRALVGALDRVPVLTIGTRDLSSFALDHRSAFLLSQIDGTLTYEELIDVSGMTGEDVFRILARLLHKGIIAVVE